MRKHARSFCFILGFAFLFFFNNRFCFLLLSLFLFFIVLNWKSSKIQTTSIFDRHFRSFFVFIVKNIGRILVGPKYVLFFWFLFFQFWFLFYIFLFLFCLLFFTLWSFFVVQFISRKVKDSYIWSWWRSK